MFRAGIDTAGGGDTGLTGVDVQAKLVLYELGQLVNRSQSFTNTLNPLTYLLQSHASITVDLLLIPLLSLHASAKPGNYSVVETWDHLMKLTEGDDGDWKGDGADEKTRRFTLPACDALLFARICMQLGKSAKMIITQASKLAEFPLLPIKSSFPPSFPPPLLVRILLHDATQGHSEADLLKGNLMLIFL